MICLPYFFIRPLLSFWWTTVLLRQLCKKRLAVLLPPTPPSTPPPPPPLLLLLNIYLRTYSHRCHIVRSDGNTWSGIYIYYYTG